MSPDGLLDGRYKIVGPIGSGGMAEVFLAEDNLLGRGVAVKILRSQFIGDEEFVIRFRQEARAAARLSHPNIVSVYDVGIVENVQYIVMEYVAGETLKERIRREGPLPFAQALEIAMQVAAALKHAHENSIIHCDIKPHNILLSRDGTAKVTDFGIARAVTSQTTTQVAGVVGSVHYLSPEQAQGGGVDAQSDIYSLGVVLYEMLVGMPPFEANTAVGVALKHLNEKARPLQEVNPEIPADLAALTEKAMAKNAADRHADAQEFLEEADAVLRRLRGETVPAKDAKIRKKMRQGGIWSRLKGLGTAARWKWGLAAILALSFLIGQFIATGGFGGNREVIIPDIVGKPAETARSLLLNENLKVQISEAYDERVPAGYVISQLPLAGQIVKENRPISIVVSKGTEMTAIPDLKGLVRRDAEARIRSAGLKVGRVEEQFAADVPADTVVLQNPRPPGQVTKGVLIDFVVSKGASPRRITLPDFQGESLQSVMARVDALKLRLGTVREVSTSRFPPGTVSSQSPGSGSLVFEGASVDLEVVRSTSGVAKRAKIQSVVPEGPIRQALQIVVTDAGGRRIAYEGVHKPGERIEKIVEGTGPMTVQVYANGKMIQEQSF